MTLHQCQIYKNMDCSKFVEMVEWGVEKIKSSKFKYNRNALKHSSWNFITQKQYNATGIIVF